MHTYPHDPHAFTQGLIYVDGHLYESTGLTGQSSLRLVDLASVLTRYHEERPLVQILPHTAVGGNVGVNCAVAGAAYTNVA